MGEDFVDFTNPIEQSGMDVRTCALLDGPCQSFPCSNGATCIGLGDSFQCRCPVRFSGELCDEGLCTVLLLCTHACSVCVCVCVCVYVHVRACVCVYICEYACTHMYLCLLCISHLFV